MTRKFLLTNVLLVLFFTVAAQVDLRINYVLPGVVDKGTTVTPALSVKNIGSSALFSGDLTISITINDAQGNQVYSDSKTGTYTVYVGDSINIVFTTPWTPDAEGTYTVSASVTYTDDADNSNNSLTIDVPVVDFSYPSGRMYAFVIDGNNADLLNHILEIDMNDYYLSYKDVGFYNKVFWAADMINGVVWLVERETNEVYWLNGDGSLYHYGKISSVPYYIYGITSNGTDIYIVDYYLDAATSTYKTEFRILDNKLIATSVSSTDKAIVSIASDVSGTIYAFDLIGQKTYTVSTSGAYTEVGPFVKPVYGYMDFSLDRDNDVIYGAAVEVDTNDVNTLKGYKIVKLDKNTGEVSDFAKGLFDFKIAACAVTPGVVPGEPIQTAADENTWNVKIYPNPSDGAVNISGAQNSTVTISDINGKIVYSSKILNNNQYIDLSGLSGGVYIVRIVGTNKAVTKKIVIR